MFTIQFNGNIEFNLVIMTECKVPLCSKVHKKDTDVSFHMFPKETELRVQWKKFCGLFETDIITNTHRVCSLHFEKECFQSNLMVEFGLKSRPTLNYGGESLEFMQS